MSDEVELSTTLQNQEHRPSNIMIKIGILIEKYQCLMLMEVIANLWAKTQPCFDNSGTKKGKNNF